MTGRRSLTLSTTYSRRVKHAGWGFRAAVTLVLLGLALVATGCGTADSPQADRALAYHPAPEVPPIRRLGRWNGTTFVPVAPGTVRGGNLSVLVHGWAPGYRFAVGHYRGPGVLLAWAPQAVDQRGQGMFTEFRPMAAAITRDDPTATVLGFSWLDDSATARSRSDAWKSEAKTDLNGQRLAAALGQVLAPSFSGGGGRIHLIGNGHGAKVATVAAIALDRPPAQLTLLDSPENVPAQLPGRRTTSRAISRCCRSDVRPARPSSTATSRSRASATGPSRRCRRCSTSGSNRPSSGSSGETTSSSVTSTR